MMIFKLYDDWYDKATEKVQYFKKGTYRKFEQRIPTKQIKEIRKLISLSIVIQKTLEYTLYKYEDKKQAHYW